MVHWMNTCYSVMRTGAQIYMNTCYAVMRTDVEISQHFVTSWLWQFRCWEAETGRSLGLAHQSFQPVGDFCVNQGDAPVSTSGLHRHIHRQTYSHTCRHCTHKTEIVQNIVKNETITIRTVFTFINFIYFQLLYLLLLTFHIQNVMIYFFSWYFC